MGVRSNEVRTSAWVGTAFENLSWPLVAAFLLHNPRIHKSYRMTWRRKVALARRMRRTTRAVQTGVSYRAHLAMAARMLEIPPEVDGVLVEAGCWKGGTTANLSLIAEIMGRDLIVYDSFEGLPEPAEGDRWASPLGQGAFRGELEEVQANVAAWGAIDRCTFRKGWFADTMGDHTKPIVAAFVDVDHQASMHDCMLGLWPHLCDQGYLFVDEYLRLDYCALFFSERYWRTYFDRPPPGLMGAGTGVPVGQFFVGPQRATGPLESASSVGWTRKDFYGAWDYFPDDGPVEPLRGGAGDRHSADGWTTTTRSTEERTNSYFTALIASDEAARERFAARLESEESREALERALTRDSEAVERLAARMAESDEGRASLERAFATDDEARARLAVALESEAGRRAIAEALAAGELAPPDDDG
jgi:O-methyltransferase